MYNFSVPASRCQQILWNIQRNQTRLWYSPSFVEHIYGLDFTPIWFVDPFSMADFPEHSVRWRLVSLWSFWIAGGPWGATPESRPTIRPFRVTWAHCQQQDSSHTAHAGQTSDTYSPQVGQKNFPRNFSGHPTCQWEDILGTTGKTTLLSGSLSAIRTLNFKQSSTESNVPPSSLMFCRNGSQVVKASHWNIVCKCGFNVFIQVSSMDYFRWDSLSNFFMYWMFSAWNNWGE